jgi:hypothetical protein
MGGGRDIVKPYPIRLVEKELGVLVLLHLVCWALERSV